MALFATAEGRAPEDKEPPKPASREARHKIEFTKDTLEIVKKNLAEGKAVLVDVRSQEEWDRGHLEEAVFVPIDSLRKKPDLKMLAKKLPEKEKILYTFCVVGMRAKAAAIKLQQQGYTVRPLKPGYEQLLKAGFQKGEGRSVPKKDAARKKS